MRTVIGIDPGLASTGWGVVRFDGSRFVHVGHGVVTTEPDLPLPERLLRIHTEISRLIASHHPSEAGVEDLFFSKNTSSAMQVAQARGVVLGLEEVPGPDHAADALAVAICHANRTYSRVQ